MSVTTTKNFEKYYVLDTNIILQDAESIMTLSDNSENLIIIPETVIDEIDVKKTGNDEINYQAREFGRILGERAKVVDTQEISVKNEIGEIFVYSIISLEIVNGTNTLVDIVSKDFYEATSDNTPLNIYNDRKILEIATFVQNNYKNNDSRIDLEFLSLDIMARTRAISLNLPTNTLLGSESDDFDQEFHKIFELDSALEPKDLEGLDILSIDKEHKPQNFSYTFRYQGRDILGSIQDGKICIFDEAEIRQQLVAPRNKEQLFFSNAIDEDFYQILAVDARAGSGKTLLSLSGAMRLVRKKKFKKIVYIRNSIESLDKGEDVGYLAGNEEKFAIYNHPLMDSMEYIANKELMKSANNKSNGKASDVNQEAIQEKINSDIAKYGIETMWTGEARGRTISNSVVIIDEAQNMSNKTMQLILTRIDDSCKVIILGSNKQIDNFFTNKHTNGLSTILKSTNKKYENINLFSIQLQKVLRGPITEWAESIFSD